MSIHSLDFPIFIDLPERLNQPSSLADTHFGWLSAEKQAPQSVGNL